MDNQYMQDISTKYGSLVDDYLNYRKIEHKELKRIEIMYFFNRLKHLFGVITDDVFLGAVFYAFEIRQLEQSFPSQVNDETKANLLQYVVRWCRSRFKKWLFFPLRSKKIYKELIVEHAGKTN